MAMSNMVSPDFGSYLQEWQDVEELHRHLDGVCAATEKLIASVTFDEGGRVVAFGDEFETALWETIEALEAVGDKSE